MDTRDLGKEPISADQPAGRDVAYDDDYEELSDEIKKLSSPTADSVIDWSKVIQLCKKILAEESKNLQVACYLSVALCHTEGLAGCATGMHILRQLLDNFWDTLYPPKKRKKGRINALGWWNEKTRDFLEQQEPETWDQKRRTEVVDDLTALDAFVGDNLPDGPVLRPLIETLSSLILEEQIPVEEPEPADNASVEQTVNNGSSPAAENTAPSNTQTTTTTATSTVAAAADDSADADDYFASGSDFLAQAATKFFNQDTTRPLSYQLNRLIAWGQVDSLPPAQKGKTMLPPPDEQVVTLLRNQYQAGQWEDLLAAAESHVRQYLFWLDLSFWVATALEQLHADVAAMAVTNETLLYTHRLQSLERLSFADGMPFAGEETREWLLNSSRAAADASAAVSDGTAAASADCQAAALKILADKGLAEALEFFKKNTPLPNSGRGRFDQDLAVCRILLKDKQAELARPFAERLLDQVAKMSLETWDPELAFAAMLTAYKAFTLADQDELEPQVTALRDRLTLLAPERALHFI